MFEKKEPCEIKSFLNFCSLFFLHHRASRVDYVTVSHEAFVYYAEEAILQPQKQL